jgi:flagellar protein FliO/FliZ
MGESVELLSRLVPSLALIVGALLLVRRWAQRGSGGGNAGIRVLARAGLTRGAMVAVVEVGEQRYLVGASEHGVSLLSEVPDSELPEELLQDAAMDVPLPQLDRPRMGLIDRLRDMTVRTHLERSIRAPGG